MVMYEQSRRLSEPLHWGRGQKFAVAAFLAACVLALAVAAIVTLTDSTPARADCIKVNFAGTLGGSEIHGCGAQARRICASGSFSHIEAELRSACTHAGFAYRPPSSGSG
jgi:hypothetical protein